VTGREWGLSEGVGAFLGGGRDDLCRGRLYFLDPQPRVSFGTESDHNLRDVREVLLEIPAGAGEDTLDFRFQSFRPGFFDPDDADITERVQKLVDSLLSFFAYFGKVDYFSCPHSVTSAAPECYVAISRTTIGRSPVLGRQKYGKSEKCAMAFYRALASFHEAFTCSWGFCLQMKFGV
jgi:hypothetical protein